MTLIIGENSRECNSCSKVKPFKDFYKNKTGKYGHSSKCKPCSKQYGRKYYSDNKDERLEYYQKHQKDKLRVTRIVSDCVNRNWKAFRDKLNQSKHCSYCKVYKPFDEFYNANADYGKYGLTYNCKQCCYERKKAHIANNKEHYKKYWRQRQRKLREDEGHRIKRNLRARLSHIASKNTMSKATQGLVGCSKEKFKQHIQMRFDEGMSWDNYGEWCFDHIVPCAIFDLTKRMHRQECFHNTNRQALWLSDNAAKGTGLNTGYRKGQR